MNIFDVKNARKLRFFEGLLSLYRATGDLRQAFRFLHDQLGSTPEGRAADEVVRSLEHGSNLTQALTLALPGLSGFECSLLEVGEHAGGLEASLEGIIHEIQLEQQIRIELLSRLAYPVFLLHFAGLVFCFIQSMAHGWSLTWPLVYFGALYAPVVLAWVVRRRQRHNPDMNDLLLRLPGLGGWLLDRLRTRFTFALGQLYSAGIPLARALEITADNVDPVRGRVFQELRQAAAAARQGAPLSSHIPSMLDHSILRDAIRVGERAGSLSEELSRASRYYREQADRDLKRLVRFVSAGVYATAVLVVVYLVFSVYGWYFSLLG